MIRIAFTLIGGRNWTGGYNYLLNLVRVLSERAADRVQAVVFFGMDADVDDVAPFEAIGGVSVVRHASFNEALRGRRLRQALVSGCDRLAANAFHDQEIKVVFEPAQFYGWRFPIPAVAWIPDFQHRYLKQLFDAKAYWKREIGFRTQILCGREIMLSSEDARHDCERFYPSTRGRTHVVRFAVPPLAGLDEKEARAIADSHDLPDRFYFLPNQFWQHKNHACVIEALQVCRAQGAEIVVAASGKQADPRDPGHFPRLQQLIDNNQLAPNFRLLGLIPHAHIPALMRTCTALINPSRFEGWSTTVEEAKSMGTPMILSSLKVHEEQSSDARFFDPDSPGQLADILMNFVPIPSGQRESLCADAAIRAEASTHLFAQTFAGLMERAADQ